MPSLPQGDHRTIGDERAQARFIKDDAGTSALPDLIRYGVHIQTFTRFAIPDKSTLKLLEQLASKFK